VFKNKQFIVATSLLLAGCADSGSISEPERPGESGAGKAASQQVTLFLPGMNQRLKIL
jgi:uncharacterized lipoprotein YajG